MCETFRQKETKRSSKLSWVKFAKYRRFKGPYGRELTTSSQAMEMRMRALSRKKLSKNQLSVREAWSQNLWLVQELNARQYRFPSVNLQFARKNQGAVLHHPKKLDASRVHKSGDLSLVCDWWLLRWLQKMLDPLLQQQRRRLSRLLHIRGQNMNQSLQA